MKYETDSKYAVRGTRIQLLDMPDDPNPIPSGSEGTVVDQHWHDVGRTPFAQIHVDWDCGRSLFLSCPPDLIRIEQWRTIQSGDHVVVARAISKTEEQLIGRHFIVDRIDTDSGGYAVVYEESGGWRLHPECLDVTTRKVTDFCEMTADQLASYSGPKFCATVSWMTDPFERPGKITTSDLESVTDELLQIKIRRLQRQRPITVHKQQQLQVRARVDVTG